MESNSTQMQIKEVLFEADWMRKREIGSVLVDKSARTVGNAISHLKKTGEISEFLLPDFFGYGYMLTAYGAEQIQDRLGASISESLRKTSKNKKSIPDKSQFYPRQWLHHLLSVNALNFLSKTIDLGGFIGIVYENQIRKDYPWLKKIPDGLLLYRQGYISIEVENIRKNGSNLLKLSEVLIDFNNSCLPRLYDRECIDVVLVHKMNPLFSSLDDIKEKIQETAIGNYSFSYLSVEVDAGNVIIPGSVEKITFRASGEHIIYNRLNQAIFAHTNKNYDDSPNRIIFVRDYSVEYFCKGKNDFRWAVRNHYVNKGYEVGTGQSDRLEQCKVDFCKCLFEEMNTSKIAVDDFEIN